VIIIAFNKNKPKSVLNSEIKERIKTKMLTPYPAKFSYNKLSKVDELED